MGDHDKLFRRVFSVPSRAAQELRCVLPPAISAAIDFASLEQVPGTFVDPQLRGRVTDLLFRARFADRAEAVFLYFLIEHQSASDPRMPWRVLEYQTRIWSRLMREEPNRNTLPPVVTLVVHHGEGGWTAPRRFHEMVEGLSEVPELARFVPNLEILIDDLALARDHELVLRSMDPLSKVSLWLLRDGRDIDRLFEHLQAWASDLECLVREGDLAEVEVILRYIFHVGGEASHQMIRERLLEAVPAVEEPMASAAEQLMEQGRKEGLERGRHQTLRANLDRLLRARFGDLPPTATARLDQACFEDLDAWFEAALSAATLDEVFPG